jgi:hypothetical protein
MFISKVQEIDRPHTTEDFKQLLERGSYSVFYRDVLIHFSENTIYVQSMGIVIKDLGAEQMWRRAVRLVNLFLSIVDSEDEKSELYYLPDTVVGYRFIAGCKDSEKEALRRLG